MFKRQAPALSTWRGGPAPGASGFLDPRELTEMGRSCQQDRGGRAGGHRTSWKRSSLEGCSLKAGLGGSCCLLPEFYHPPTHLAAGETDPCLGNKKAFYKLRLRGMVGDGRKRELQSDRQCLVRARGDAGLWEEEEEKERKGCMWKSVAIWGWSGGGWGWGGAFLRSSGAQLPFHRRDTCRTLGPGDCPGSAAPVPSLAGMRLPGPL